VSLLTGFKKVGLCPGEMVKFIQSSTADICRQR